MRNRRRLNIAQYIVLTTISVVFVYVVVTSFFYYDNFTGTTNSLVDFQSEEISKQIVLNYENYISQTVFTSNYIQKELEQNDYDDLSSLFELTSNSTRDINSVTLFDNSGNILLSSESDVYNISYLSESWIYEAKHNADIFYFSAPHEQTIVKNDTTSVISVSKVVKYYAFGEQKNGVLTIDLNSDIIIELSRTTNLGENGHIILLDNQNRVIYSSKTECLGGVCESINVVNENILGDFETVIEEDRMKVNINTLSQTRWKLVTFLNIEEVRSSNDNNTLFLIIISFTSVTITVITAYMLSNRIRRPLGELKEYMKEVEEGNFDSSIEVSGQKEIEEIAGAFNDMVSTIQDLMVELVDEQNQKLKNELTALQHQINPHFLYNTLDSIVWLAENERNDDVIKTVVALARFFRISISKGRNMITVKEEIQHIKNYLVIQTVRYVDKFSYSIDVPKELNGLPCMKLILQPIVENAIYHGVGIEKGEIMIVGRESDGFLIFEVTNSGYGITQEKIQNIYDTIKNEKVNKGVGMRNVYQRLKLYYGEKADIEIESELDESTTVRLIIPIMEVENEE